MSEKNELNNINIPSADALQSMVGTLMSNPDLLKNIMGALGGTAASEKNSTQSTEGEADAATADSITKKDEETQTHASVPSIPPELISKLPILLSALGGGGAPKSQGCSNREALLCALKPYLSQHRAEAIEKIIQLSRLGDLFGSH